MRILKALKSLRLSGRNYHAAFLLDSFQFSFESSTIACPVVKYAGENWLNFFNEKAQKLTVNHIRKLLFQLCWCLKCAAILLNIYHGLVQILISFLITDKNNLVIYIGKMFASRIDLDYSLIITRNLHGLLDLGMHCC